MSRRASPVFAAAIAVGLALAVSAAWCGRARVPASETAMQSTVAVRITRHDTFGVPSKPIAVREPAGVRAIMSALGVDVFTAVPCPADYATAEVGLVLSGRDVYARRNVYIWDLLSDAGPPNVLLVSSSGCRGGPPADARALRESLVDPALR